MAAKVYATIAEWLHSTGLHSTGLLGTACLRGGLQISLQAQHLALPLTQLLSQGVQLGLMLGLQGSVWSRLRFGVCACWLARRLPWRCAPSCRERGVMPHAAEASWWT